MMKTYMTRIFTMLMLTMVSMGAWADVKVVYGEKGEDKFTGTGGTIEATAQSKPNANDEVTITLTVAPADGYTISKSDIEVYATISPSATRTGEPQISGKLELKGNDPKDLSEKRDYIVTVKSNLGLWVKVVNFKSASKDGPTRATDYKYVIINNKGNKAFNYTIRGDITYSSINKEQLCVHPKAKSVLATNFRFYTTEAAAVADANGTIGTSGTDYYTEGTAISGITGVTDNTFYVRYSLKDNPAIDINGGKLYKIQARNRKGTLFYIAYQASDKSIRIKSADGNDNSFLWKLDSGDPYDMYIYNIQGTADHSNGVFTVRNVVNTDGESALSSIYYDDEITLSYNQSASPMNLQSFILTQGSTEGYQYNTNWNNVWGSSYQIIGAYNAIENKPRDESPKDSKYRLPGNMPYYVCVNGSSDNVPGKDGDQLQFYRNWRVEDNTSTNTSQIKFIEVKQTYTFHIIDNSGAEAISASTASVLNAGATITESMIPDIIKSPLASNYTFYSTAADAAAGSNALTRLPYPSHDVYVRYTTNGGDLNVNGGTDYYVSTAGKYLYASDASAIGIESSVTSTDNTRKWKITGNDAYQLTLQNADNSNYVTYNVSSGEAVPTLSASGSKFFFHQSTNGKYEIVAATSNDFSTTDYYTLGVANNTLKLYSKTNQPLGENAVQTIFSDRDFCAKPQITFNNSNNQITISSTTDGASIYYTTDGTPPTSSSTLYSGAFTASDGTTVKAIVTKSGAEDSEVASLTIVLTPTITLEGTPYTYDGTAKEPTVSSVKVGETIVDPSEYTVSYSNNINAGSTATVTITDNDGGDYYVAGSTTFTIDQLSIGSGTTPATGFIIDVSMSGDDYQVTVKYNGTTLTENTDYTWTGGPTVTVTGIGNYSGTATATYVAVTPGYYALHQNGAGYLRVNGEGVNLSNEGTNGGTFKYSNVFSSDGNCIWYLTPDGYLQNEYFYLNVANNNSLYLDVTPVTRWRTEAVTGDVHGKQRIKINDGTQDLYICYDSSSKVVKLKSGTTGIYNVCPITITETATSWTGTPSATNLTLQSSQLVTYLRAYFKQKISYEFYNDAGTKVAANDKERYVYGTLTYASGGTAKGTNWDISASGIIYNLTTSDVAVKANYNILPADPVVRAAHPTPATKEITYTIQPKALTIDNTKNYILFSYNAGYLDRYPYDDGIAEGSPVKSDGIGGTGTNSVLTDPDNNPNTQISWKITVDDEGLYSFKNVSTNRYLYFNDNPHASSDYGTLCVGATTLPTGDAAKPYKFRLFQTKSGDFDPCYYIIPYSKQFAVYKNNGVASGIYSALNNNNYKTHSTKVISLFTANYTSAWCIYKYEAEYRIKTDFTISGNSSTSTTGNQEFKSEGWYGKFIKESPKSQTGLAISGTYTTNNVQYAWTVEGLSDYSSVVNGTGNTYSATGNSGKTLTINVTSLPVSSVSGVIKLRITGGTGSNEKSHENSIAFTILGNENIDWHPISSLSEITNESYAYRLTSDASGTPGVTTFSGILDGDGHTISGLTAPLFETLNNGTVCNVNLSGVNITSHSGPTGAIAGTANGGSRIYNVGILSGGVGSSDNYCGGLVGLLDGSARVINCFSYANITGGTDVGGIVGYNNYETKSNDARTMVMNCMFYGDITDGTSKAPIYNGKIITNRSDENGVSNFNYFWSGASYVRQNIDVYNCALAAETRFLQRFEFFRPLLNSNRALAAWWATGNRDKKDEMMKWVMEPSQIGTATPYPILKPAYDSNNAIIKYPSVVNIDADHAEAFSNDADTKKTQYNQGRKFGTLTINIENASSGAPEGASITTPSVTPNITDKDPAHFNFNYYKVQLPYYNDVGTGNYTDYKVVTGWEVTVSGGTNVFSNSSSDATASVDANGDITLTTPYNFADRKSTGKDDFATSGRIFNQGAYFDVPEGVTSITIKPHWAKCVYVSDQYPEVVYNQDMSTGTPNNTIGGGSRYTNGNEYTINGSSQKVYTTMANAVTALDPSGTVYNNAIVLVGNVHSLDLSNKLDSKPYTIMSIDLDKDNEPDYSYILRFNSRARVHPVRIDFLNVIGLGMAQKSSGGTGTYNLGIMQPYGWFEVTNTGLFRVTQFEYDLNGRANSPMILQGGVIEQWVTVGGKETSIVGANSVTYYHVGGNVWFKEFHIGVHQDKTQDQFYSPHPPISVTGGEYENFYLTGYYNSPNANCDDNAECYINGGRFNKVAGTGMQGIGAIGGGSKGNIIWQINNADINEFYAGGINAAHIAEGNITSVISNSRVDQFCGGPKFGNMNSGKIVATNATNCTFRTFFGAGYGGNSYNRRYPANKDNLTSDPSWDSWVSTEYQNDYNPSYKGVSTRIDYQYIPQSDNVKNVARLFVDYVSFSLATTHDVTSKLTGCTITKSPLGSLDLFDGCIGNFYGGGSLGKVDGPVKTTLTNCTVEGNVFGAGYSATLPSVGVMNNSFQTPPKYDGNLGAYLEAVLPTTTKYTWQHRDETINSTALAIDQTNHILYTNENLTDLGKVTGTATLNIEGTTTVAGNVYGGGEESNVEGDTQVNISGGTIGNSADANHGNVFGGGKGSSDNFECDKAMVGVNDDGKCEDPGSAANKDKGTKVNITNGTVNGNVYGGGEVGRVEWNTQVTIGEAGDTQNTPTVNGSVFGAGAGKETHGYSALVRGNSTVTVQGKAKVLQNVYGGGEKATVGRYWVKGIHTTLCAGDPNETVIPTAPDDLPTGMPYKQRRGGVCTVSILDNAQIGPDNGGTETAGHVFGAGKGVVPGTYNFASFSGSNRKNYPKRMALYDAEKYLETDKEKTWEYVDPQNTDTNKNIWEYFNTEEKYLTFLQTLALITNSSVVIGGHATVTGSVYGGSESGFVQHNTSVTIEGSSTIGINGTVETNGNIFGGGLGLASFAEAGRVGGNTIVNVNGGTVWRNVYGGGSLGSLGKFTYEVNTTTHSKTYTWTEGGTCNVTIDALNDNTTVIKGNVFGAGKGSNAKYECEPAMALHSNVTINNGTVNGTVYGGGEIGRVDQNTTVTIGKAGDETSEPDINGDVFGAGAGVDTHGYSALVRGNSSVTVQGKAKVGNNVYGGGKTASVGRFVVDAETSLPKEPVSGGICTVTIKDKASIGYEGGGDVYGACKGVEPGVWNSLPGHVTADSDDPTPFTSEADYLHFLKTLALTSNTNVSIDGNATVNGSVYGGGQRGITLAGVKVDMTGGTVNKDVYGGGALADTNTENWDDTNKTLTKYHEETRLTPGSSVVGYYTKDGNEYTLLTSGTVEEGTTYYRFTDTKVNLLGGKIKGDAYGGGLGRKASTGVTAVEALVYGDVKVELNNNNNGGTAIGTQKGCIVNRVFGCNNLNGTPKGKVQLYVYATQKDGAATLGAKATKNTNTYDVQAVYGGGNLAPYIPYEATLNDDETNTARTEVYIDGCDLTSIKQVYGGGNAAPAPATYVEINRAYEIDEVFGGGNGADNYSLLEGSETKWYENPGANVGYYTYASYPKTGENAGDGTSGNPWKAVEIEKFSGGSEHKDNRLSTEDPDAIAIRYGSGIATLVVKGGTIHTAYGGSNSKGNVRKQLSSTYSSMFDDCEMSVATTYGGGKNAYSDADAEVTADCAKGVRQMFGGATAADFNGDINLRITNGSSLERVFGGNNTSGAVNGSITVTIEEGGCEPIRIGSLYLGGYLAPYSVYGYNDDKSPKESGTRLYNDPRIIVISATRIDNIFGGGYQAKLVGNPHINVNMQPGRILANYVVNTTENPFVGEHKDANNNVIYVGKVIEEGTGDGILEIGTIGNIYGGGNKADVIGDTFVEIGTGQWHNQDNASETTSTDGKTYTYNKTTQKWVDTEDATNIKDAVPAPARYTAKITGDVFGGGNEAHVSGNTNVYIGAREKTTGVWESVAEASDNVTIDGTQPATGFGRGVFGGGNKGNVVGNSYVYFGGGTVNQTIYGGGCEADVKGNTNVTMLNGYVYDGVCGGGLSGSVGTIKTKTTAGKPDTFESNTGKCTVVITGGQVGPVEVATEGMTRRNSDNNQYEPVSEGWVWGASRGVVIDPTSDPDSDFKTYVNETDVTIGGTAFILEGVVGGGEFGHVRGNTLVKIQDQCQIGVGAGKAENGKPIPYTKAQWDAAEDAVRAGDADAINAIAAQMPSCSHFNYGRVVDGKTVYDTYDPYADTYDHPYPGGSTTNVSDGKTWIGCVFGGGSGYMPYVNKEGNGYNWDPAAGLVEGNSEVQISGGHILTCVYGGNEVTSVLGTSKVTMTGGTIGVPRTKDELKTNPMIGNLFGAGKGDPRSRFDDLTNVGSAEVEISGGIIYGSVYGGSENGHVLGDVNVTIEKNSDNNILIPVIGTWGSSYIDGNVFGGGMGTTTNVMAGLVKGNTNITISNGTILHNIYGGGAYGSVGTFDLSTDANKTTYNVPYAGMPVNWTANTGKATISITGGTIGTTGNENGMVFGSSRGDVDYDYTNNIDPNDRLAWVYSTNVKIGNNGQSAVFTSPQPQIFGSVYGSGENGHTWQNTVIDIYSGTIGIVSKDDKYKLTADGVTYAGADYPYRGNVYGGGCGTDKYASFAVGSKDTYNPLAGIVRGTTEVNIRGGQVAHNVYGAGAMGSVGGSTDEGAGKTTINITGGRIGDDGDGDGNIYGAARGDTDYTGANRDNVAQVRETDVNINYATAVTSDNEEHTAQLITGSVFGGGEAGVVTGSVAVDMTKGLVLHDVYGGGALANSNTANWDSNAGGWVTGENSPYHAPTESAPAYTDYTTTVTLTGGMINGNVYGGGLGRKYQEAVPYQAAQGTYGQEGYVPEVEQQDAIEGIPAKVYGDVTVKLNETTDTDDCVVKGNIFGCNNLNGSPQNQVSVYVYKTKGWDGHTRTVPGKLDSETESDHVYDVEAVYGGGNLAAYEPYNARKDASDTEKAQTYAKVVVSGCDLTSIRQVYGGGNAASSPATSVTIHSAYEIEEVFGGGNGYGFLPDGTKNPGANVGYEAYPEDYDPPASTAEYRTENYGYGSGKASVNIYNGRIHRVFGGSNTKGNVRVTAVTILEKMDEDCSFVIDEAYGGGKSAPMDAEAKLLMSCIPGLKEVYGGAQDADIINDVVLNISNGTFDRVFGGNNKSGSIHGTITVNIEETGCKPLIIGQLYGGGNLAPYTAPEGQPGPTVNVKAFTSIGEIYGGGFGAGADVTGDTYVNINEVILSKDDTHQSEDYSIKPFIQQAVVDEDHPLKEYENIELSDGTKYKLWNRPVKNAGTENAVPAMGVIGNVFGGGNEAAVIGNTHVNIGNKATETIVTLDKVGGNYQEKPVVGVDIRGNVYGGGNKANVTGDTNVRVGKAE